MRESIQGRGTLLKPTESSQSDYLHVEMDDQHLIRRIRRGEKEAFDALFDRYGARLRAFAFRLTGNENLADDLVQDAFLAAFRSFGGYRGDSPIFNWLCGIVVRRYRTQCRRSRSEPEITSEGFVEVADALDIERSVLALADGPREAFILVKVIGFTHVEAAGILKKPVGTVKWLVVEAVRLLRNTLNEVQTHEI